MIQAGYVEYPMVARLPSFCHAGHCGHSGFASGCQGCGVLDAGLAPRRPFRSPWQWAVIAIVLNLIPTTATKFASSPFLAIMLGGASNYLVSPDHHLGPLRLSPWPTRCSSPWLPQSARWVYPSVIITAALLCHGLWCAGRSHCDCTGTGQPGGRYNHRQKQI